MFRIIEVALKCKVKTNSAMLGFPRTHTNAGECSRSPVTVLNRPARELTAKSPSPKWRAAAAMLADVEFRFIAPCCLPTNVRLEGALKFAGLLLG